MRTFFRAGHEVLHIAEIRSLDTSSLEQYRVRVRLNSQREIDLVGPDAIELVLLIRPSALEGRRLRWVRRAWAVHNLVGHPGMQVLSMLGMPKLGILLHEMTVPKPVVGE